MAITPETSKRLWGRSGNRCAMCRTELIRPDEDGLPGALIGEQAHIIAKSPGGARYKPLDPATRDGYDNLILLCANDHTEVDSRANGYSVVDLQAIKHRHEQWVTKRLQSASPDDGPTVATVMQSGDDLWPLVSEALGWMLGTPNDLADEEEDLIDAVLQTFTDWCDISSDVELQGLSRIREAKRSITSEINSLTSAGFVLLGGRRQTAWGDGTVFGPAMVLEVVRSTDLASVPLAGPGTSIK